MSDIRQQVERANVTAFIDKLQAERDAWRAVADGLAESAQLLHDFQNGSPLPNYDKMWSKAMNGVEIALEAHEALKRNETRN